MNTQSSVITTAQHQQLQQFMNNQDRTGFYIALHNMTGSQTALDMAQISSRSNLVGGVAWLVNDVYNGAISGYPSQGTDYFSFYVAQADFDSIALAEGTTDQWTVPSDINMYLTARVAWHTMGLSNGVSDLEKYFPGNWLIAKHYLEVSDYSTAWNYVTPTALEVMLFGIGAGVYEGATEIVADPYNYTQSLNDFQAANPGASNQSYTSAYGAQLTIFYDAAGNTVGVVRSDSALQVVDKIVNTVQSVLSPITEQLNRLGLWIGDTVPLPGEFRDWLDLSRNATVEKVLDQISRLFSDAEDTTSPLILDLDGDGVETLSIAAGVLFDHNANGAAEATGWVGKDDGLLVWDRNSNGVIDNGQELFGNNTPLSGGGSASNGFTALASLNSNNDSVFTAADTAYSQLRVWKDSNSNGLTDPGELLTLAAAGVQSINLVYDVQSSSDENGNQHRQASSYTTATGSTLDVSDVWFTRNLTRIVNTTTSAVSTAIAALPDIAGFGSVPSLHQAMFNDISGHLQSLVQAYVAEPDAAIRATLLDGVIYAWAGVESVSPTSRGIYFADARKLAALEEFSGRAFVQGSGTNAGTSSPGPNATQVLLNGYGELSAFVSSRLLAGSQQAALYSGLDLVWNATTIRLQWDVVGAISQLQAAYATNAASGAAKMREFAAGLRIQGAVGDSVLALMRLQGNATGQGFQYELGILGFDVALNGGGANDLLNGSNTNDIISGFAGNDTLDGGNGNDLLLGGDGNDFVHGGRGDDIVSGGAGDDHLAGGDNSYYDFATIFGPDGDDTYIYGRGDGHDTIHQDRLGSDNGLHDIVQFGTGVKQTDLIFTFNAGPYNGGYGSLTINFRNSDGSISTTDSLIIENYFYGEALQRSIAEFRFTDDRGQVYSAQQLDALLAGLPGTGNDILAGASTADTISGGGGNDTIHGWLGNDVLSGGTGDDDLYGGGGNDTINGDLGDDLLEGGDGADILNGGTGNDELTGGSGSDVYVYNLGDGDDVITGTPDSSVASIDAIQFGVGINPQDVSVILNPNYTGNALWLLIRNSATGEIQTITVKSGLDPATGSQVLDEIRFANGATWTRADIYTQFMTGGSGNDTLRGFGGNDVLRGNGGDDRLFGDAGNDDLTGGTGWDRLFGDGGDDIYRFGRGQGKDELLDNSGANRIVLDAGITAANVSLYRTSSSSDIGLKEAFYLSGDSGDHLVLVIDGGSDQIWVNNYFSTQYPSLLAQISFADGTNWDATAIAAHLISQAGTHNVATGTAGNDSFVVDFRTDVINEAANSGIDNVVSSVTYKLADNLENLTLTGVLDISATGNNLQNTIQGNAGDNHLHGGYEVNGYDDSWADTLIGGAGNDTYTIAEVGGVNPNDIVIEAANEGYDTIVAESRSATLPVNVEALIVHASRWGGSATQLFQGNALDNVIDARSADVNGYGLKIDGGVGADLMIGPDSVVRGNNAVDWTIRYVVDNPGDVVVGGPGVWDMVLTSISYALPDTVERLQLTGSAAINGTGNALANFLDGSLNTAANVLVGGLGNDTYVLGAGDVIVENAGEGSDTIQSSTGYTLNVANVENVTLTGTANVTVTGNSLDNVLTGNSGFNQLTGGGGSDTLIGGAGGDQYLGFGSTTGVDVIIDNSGGNTMFYDFAEDRVIESMQISHVGNDLKIAVDAGNSVTVQGWYSSVSNQVARVTLFEQGLAYNYNNVQLQGRADGINTAPVLNFSPGSIGATAGFLLNWQLPLNIFLDIESQHSLGYVVSLSDGSPLPAWLTFDSATRTMAGTPPTASVGTLALKVTATDAGSLSAFTTFSLNVSPGPTLGTAGNDTINGDATNNWIIGLQGNDVINGLDGNDELAGGLGNDQLFGGNGDDNLYDYDSVNGSEGGNDYLDGGAGADQMFGSVGDDIYIVDNVGDYMEEYVGEGVDEIRSSITWALGAEVWDDFEKLTLTGSGAISATGNTLDNILTGNSGSNTLTGLDGNDTLDPGIAGTDVLKGGLGNDTYVVSRTTGVTITESANEGTDLVLASVTHTLAANVENLTLTGTTAINGTGNTLANVITGNVANNVLDGGTGADTLIGGAGNDTYTVDNVGDVVTENANEGTDLVNASASFVLGSNVENLTLTGTTAINGTGNTGDNALTGNSGNNTLTGLAGNDTLDPGTAGTDVLAGGLGNDTYTVGTRSTGITINENANEGTDTVSAAATYTLGNNLENLLLTGTTAINGTGNTGDNVLTGNSGNNTLTGLGGNDTLDAGSAGTDVLVGGLGNDTYIISRTTGITVTENASEGTDLVLASVAHTLAANVENLTLTGTSAINGTGNTLANVITGNAANNTLDGGTGADTLVGGAGNDTYAVDNVADVVTENANEGTDLVNASASFVLGNNVENLTLTGITAINGTGNTGDNVLTGNSGNNTLTGLAGNDTLDPGTAGTDVLVGGLGNDTYVVGTRTTGITINENSNEGTDTISAAATYTLGTNLENLLLTGTTAINGTGNTLDNALTGNSGNNTLTGLAGNDTLYGGSAGTDVLVGGAGNDAYTVDRTTGITTTELANEGVDTVNASVTATLAANIELLFLTGTTAINGTGNTLGNLLRGNSGINTLIGGGGTDILEGGDGNDILSNTSGNTLLNGGIGTDTLTGTTSNDLLIGGTGNDALTTGAGADIIAFNKGDGQDTVAASATTDNTLSIGGGALYADLLFSKSGTNLILKVGATDQITFTNYYGTGNRSVNTLQVVIEGTSDYNAGSTNAMNNKKVETFNFGALVAAFDAALVANPSLTSWSLTNALAAQYLSGSDTTALGGDLAYRYNRLGTLSDISFTPAQALLGAANFGTGAQALQALTSLQDTTARLS